MDCYELIKYKNLFKKNNNTSNTVIAQCMKLIIFFCCFLGYATACGLSALNLFVYAIPVAIVAIPFLPLILLGYSGYKAASKINGAVNSENAVKARKIRSERSKVWANSWKDPKNVRRLLNDHYENHTNNEDTILAWAVLGFNQRALEENSRNDNKNVRQLSTQFLNHTNDTGFNQQTGVEANSQKEKTDSQKENAHEFCKSAFLSTGCEALLRTNVGDYQRACQLILENKFFDSSTSKNTPKNTTKNTTKIWNVKSLACDLHQKHTLTLDFFDEVCKLEPSSKIECEHCLWNRSVLQSTLQLSQFLSKMNQGTSTEFMYVGPSVLYEAALSINNLGKHDLRWKQAQHNLFLNALFLCRNVCVSKAFTDCDSEVYLLGCCLYSLGALALGEQTRSSVLSSDLRKGLIKRAETTFDSIITDKNNSHYVSLSKLMRKQCWRLLDETADLDDDQDLFEPWDSEFTIETSVKSHCFESTFFAKPTWCDTCASFVKSPLTNNGSTCKNCGLEKHPECNETLRPCMKKVRATPEEKRKWYNWTLARPTILVVKRLAPLMPKDVIKMIYQKVVYE
jgi:hypothetical protein